MGPPHPTILDQRASFCVLARGKLWSRQYLHIEKYAIPNKQDLSPSCFLSFFYSSNVYLKNICYPQLAIQLKR